MVCRLIVDKIWNVAIMQSGAKNKIFLLRRNSGKLDKWPQEDQKISSEAIIMFGS